MKKLIFFLFTFLFADDLYHQAKITQINLNNNIKIKFSALNYINSADLDNKEVIVGTNKTLKVYSLQDSDILKVMNINLKKVSFSSDKSKILLIHKNGHFFILDANNYKKLVELEGNFKDFDEKKGILALLSNNKFEIYDLKNGKKLAMGKGFYGANFIKISPDLKRVVVSSGDYFYIFNNKGILLNKINQYYFRDLKWLNNKEIITDNGNSYNDLKVFIYDVITSKVINTIYPYKFGLERIDKIIVLNPKKVLLLNDNKMVEINLNTNKVEKKFDLSENNNISVAKLYNNKLLIAYGKNGYVYSYPFVRIEYQISNVKKQKPLQNLPKVVVKEKVITKVVEKKVYVKNKKPTLEIYASKEEGFAPLTVTFSVVANDEDGKIIAYYMNINGKEYLSEKPKKVTYTFTKPGVYVIMAAVKDNSGNITIKKIKIKVKEETFEDFKKHL